MKLSKEILNDLSANDIVYAELSETGAMGNAGGVILYVLKDTELNRYEASLYDDNNFYSEANEFVLKYQGEFELNNLEAKEILFDYHYGGMGKIMFLLTRKSS